jgi:solute carrier family 25 phosphate transporter 3
MYSPAFYAACTAGGVASCGLTHMTVTPLDLVKCNMQVRETVTAGENFASLLMSQSLNGAVAFYFL